MFYEVMLGVTVYRRGKPQTLHFGVEGATCLDTAKRLARAFSGEVTISLLPALGGHLWAWSRLRRFRVSATARRKCGKRWARELEAELNRGRS